MITWVFNPTIRLTQNLHINNICWKQDEKLSNLKGLLYVISSDRFPKLYLPVKLCLTSQ